MSAELIAPIFLLATVTLTTLLLSLNTADCAKARRQKEPAPHRFPAR